MSFKAVVELVLHLQHYYIIQYPHQGLFSFDCTIYQVKGDKKNHAIPYQILNYSAQQASQNTRRLIVQPKIDDEKAISSTGLAKFSDEHLDMDNWFQFRLELQGYPQLQSDNIFLQIDFRFNQNNLNEPESLGELKQTVIFRLNDLENGIFNHAVAHFQPPYRSQLFFTLFGFISSFKFAKFQLTSKQADKYQKKRSKISTIKQLVEDAKTEFPDRIIEHIFFTNYVKKLRICQYLMEQRVNNVRKQPQTWQIKISPSFVNERNYNQITQKEFKQFLDKYQPLNIKIDDILLEINSIQEENFKFVQQTVKDWMKNCFNKEKMEKQHMVFSKEKYGQVVFKSILRGKEDIIKRGATSSRQNKKIARQMRDKNIVVNSYPIEDIKFQRQRQSQQLVFYEVSFPFADRTQQQIYLKLTPEEQKIRIQGNKLQYSEKHMLVVMCHGYQGSFYDMQLIKRWIQTGLPDAYYLISRSNQDNTDGDIQKMGKNLAEQVQKFIANYMQQYEQQNVIINFVGHSMGGIIARSALPYLIQKYKTQLGFFCSLSSPHLGYLNGVSGLIKVGLWAIKKFKKIESLAQLSMEDNVDPRKTFLYELSKTGHLRYFRKIILLSSYQDSYVSWHSARISPHLSSNSSTKVELQMCDNMMNNNIYGASVHRLDINFNVKSNTLDSFIGRTAHINLIIRQNMFKTISLTIPDLFKLTEFGREGLFL